MESLVAVPRSCRLVLQAKEDDKSAGDDAAAGEAGAPEEAAEEESEAAADEEEVDPFAGLDLDSKEFLQRKVSS